MKVVPDSLGTTLTVHTANLIGFRSTQVLLRLFPERSNQGGGGGGLTTPEAKEREGTAGGGGGGARGESGLHRNSTSDFHEVTHTPRTRHPCHRGPLPKNMEPTNYGSTVLNP